MKKLLLSAAVVGLLFAVQPAEPVAADANGPNASQLCKAYGDFGMTHGQCVRAFTAPNRDIMARVAHACHNPALQAIFGAKNHGQCVKALRELIKG